MAVEQDRRLRRKVLQEGQARAELVDEECIGLEGGELAVAVDGDEKVELAQDRTENTEAREDGGRDDGVASDSDVKSSCEDEPRKLAQDNIIEVEGV